MLLCPLEEAVLLIHTPLNANEIILIEAMVLYLYNFGIHSKIGYLFKIKLHII